MSKKPDRVELLQDSIVKLIFTDSDGERSTPSGANDPKTGKIYDGRATSAKTLVHEESCATFHGDQHSSETSWGAGKL
jgi:hypothetical protein